MDLDAIALGEDFVEAIETTVARCDVLIAVIGNDWLSSKDERGGRRLDNADDFVRMEIGTALRRRIRLIPVLVDGALMPRADDLPEDLRPLVRRNALSVTTTSFEGDCQRLAGAIRQVLERAAVEERDRLAAEQRQREEAEARQREEKERQEAGQRERERLEAEQREKERLEAQQREKERLEVEQREKERPLETATKEHPWVNSLGMKFVPVAGTQVLFSVWDTRVQDFEAFVAATDYDAGGTWREPGFSQGPAYPVVGVSWNDAKKFCERLTRREQDSGMLPRGWVYRLPTDAEWSAGVGLQGEEGNTPIEKSGKIKLYPWGKKWPPPKGTGNYEGEGDGYPRTSPVGSFAANANGLYDMGGNVWQWCEDWYDATEQYRVLRGASWLTNGADNLLASYRNYGTPDGRRYYIGFRCVVGAESSR